MEMKAKLRKKLLIAFLAVFLVSSLVYVATVQPVEAQNSQRIDMLVDGEDPGERKLVNMEPGEKVKLDFSIVSRLESNEYNVTWDFDGEEITGTERVLYEFDETGEYDIQVTVETENGEFTDSVVIEVQEDNRGMFLATIGAGLAVGIAGMGAGIGVGIAGAAGAGTIAEKPDKFGLALVFQALPQTQAIYGLLVAILLLLFTGVIGEAGFVSIPVGIASIGVGLSVGLAGLSAIGQGISSSSGIATVAEDDEMFGRGMVFSVLPETQAIYGLLVSILLMVFTEILGDTVTTMNMAIAAVGAGLAIGIAGLSGIGQGITSASAIAAVSNREETFGKGMIFSVMSETFAIFGLLIAILIIVSLGFMG